MKQDLGKDLLSSGNLRVITPMIKPEGLQKKVMKLVEQMKGTGADMFRLKDAQGSIGDFGYDEPYADVRKTLRKIGERKYRSLFEINVYDDEEDLEDWEGPKEGIWGTQLFDGWIMKNVGFEIGNPILEYRPFEVNFQDDNPTSNVQAKDLLNNKVYESERNNFIELDGVTSVGRKLGSKQKNIPFLIDTARKLKQYSDQIPIEAIIKVSVNPTSNTWFFPLFIIPIINSKKAIYYDWNRQEEGKYDYGTGWPYFYYKHTVSFEESGALVFDCYAGKLFDSVMNNWYFNKEDKSSTNSDYRIERFEKRMFETKQGFRKRIGNMQNNDFQGYSTDDAENLTIERELVVGL
ncbi:MAG: hypothetical protein KKF48_05515 [Nanoarchaeota archaeon]|nr:hypothetical protein [Nanoarchaeota archaeon]MBU1028475.1 hypothetical protein [Nanoarchaeota archaeon]